LRLESCIAFSDGFLVALVDYMTSCLVVVEDSYVTRVGGELESGVPGLDGFGVLLFCKGGVAGRLEVREGSGLGMWGDGRTGLDEVVSNKRHIVSTGIDVHISMVANA
jgi:hypothetical protein